MKNFTLRFSTLKKITLAILFLLATPQLRAQEMLGSINSNFSGVNGLSLNPSTFVDNRLQMDINLITFGVSIDNDYVYVPKDSLKFLGFKHLVDVIGNNGFTDAKNYKFSSGGKNASVAAIVRGPSAAFRIADHWFAIQTNVRAGSSMRNVHFAAAKWAIEKDGMHFSQDANGNRFQTKKFDAPSFNIGAMIWGELALTYGHVIYNNETGYLKGAVTIKKLFGYASAYAQVDDGMSFIIASDRHPATVYSDSSNVPKNDTSYFYVNNVNAKYGHSFGHSIDHDIPGGTSYSDQIHGHGWGFDFGITYEARPGYDRYRYEMDGKMIDDPTKNHYKVRVGFSLIDIGKIRFDKNAGDFDMKGASVSTWQNWDTVKFDNTMDFDQRVSLYTFGDKNKSKVASSYDMALPHALSMQLDYKITDYFYGNMTAYQHLGTTKPGIVAPNMLSLAPRFERNWLDVTMPFSYYNYDKFRVGLAFRIAGFVIGSDKFGSLLGVADLGGMDVYTSLKFLIERKKIADRDGDGVSDAKDNCPDEKGTWATLGCPDRDGDGILDKDDACPDVKGLLQFKGCPDRDSDGIQDKEDDCPDVPGLAIFKGCPDTDGDSIPDPQDSCVTVKGLFAFHGCPDFDGDGIIDMQDSCPTVKGPIEFHGCPDTDNDGLIDKLDSCPQVAGPISNHGCPIVVAKIEKPKEPVKVELTKEEQEVINKVFSNLEFETGKSVIRPTSFTSLNELSDLLKRKMNFKLLVDGHTDNVGGAASNLILSKNRATSVMKYLTAKGIDASRIMPKGYGLTKPIATNKTPEGRQKNRRVEFTIVE
jgi:outer membrane protein OmpA-like peptidoglycan-associated protein